VHGEGYVAWIQLMPASGSATVVVGAIVVEVVVVVVDVGGAVVVDVGGAVGGAVDAAAATPIGAVAANANAASPAALDLTSQRGYRPDRFPVADGRPLTRR
jgi:hypothetical protein